MQGRYTLYWDVSSMAPLASCLFMWYSCAYTSEASTFHSANGEGRTAVGRMPGGHTRRRIISNYQEIFMRMPDGYGCVL